MKAITATQPPNRPEPALLTFAGPQCEVLFDIFNGELGRVQLGRLLAGSDAGRLVALRKLPGAPSSELKSAIDLARSIAHPKLAKALGVLRAGDAWHVASEYIPGVSLFELTRSLINQGAKLDGPVAARIILDALNAAVAAEQLLMDTAHVPAVRSIYSESIWIAEFGETLLSEVRVSAILADAVSGEARPFLQTAASHDVRAAGLELIQLACGSTDALRDPFFPSALRDIAVRARGAQGAVPYRSIREFADALADVDPTLIASEEEVSAELRRVVGPVLDTRRQKLAMAERVSLQEGERDETKFFRASGASSTERDTARPPPGPTPGVPAARAHSSRLRIASRSEPPEEPTTIFRGPRAKPDPVPETALGDATDPHFEPPLSDAPLLVVPASDEASNQPLFSAPRLVALFILCAAIIAFGLTSEPFTSHAKRLLHWIH